VFKRAVNKLEDARVALERMQRSQHEQHFKEAFSSFVTSARSITWALQKDGKGIDRFEEWYNAKQEEMKQDDMLRFMHDVRTADTHKGEHPLHFAQQLVGGFLAGPSEAPVPGAEMVFYNGFYWVVDKDTPRERRLPLPVGGGALQMLVRFEYAPPLHRNKPLIQNDPVTVCQLTLTYMEELVYEARATFPRVSNGAKPNPGKDG
jgi:hypothetical protein